MDITKREWQLQRHCAYLGLRASRGEKWERRQLKYKDGFLPVVPGLSQDYNTINKLNVQLFSFVLGLGNEVVRCDGKSCVSPK